MFPNRNCISQQLNSAFRKNWCKACAEILDQFFPLDSDENADELNGKYFIEQKANAVTINSMKERIESLEALNDQLFQYLFFFVENLPELILKTIRSDINAGPPSEFLTISSFINPEGETRDIKNSDYPFPTRRERDVLELLAKGYCAKEIAKQLFISETTVITHKKNLKKKYNVKNTVELIFKFRNVNYKLSA